MSQQQVQAGSLTHRLPSGQRRKLPSELSDRWRRMALDEKTHKSSQLYLFTPAAPPRIC